MRFLVCYVVDSGRGYDHTDCRGKKGDSYKVTPFGLLLNINKHWKERSSQEFWKSEMFKRKPHPARKLEQINSDSTFQWLLLLLYEEMLNTSSEFLTLSSEGVCLYERWSFYADDRPLYLFKQPEARYQGLLKCEKPRGCYYHWVITRGMSKTHNCKPNRGILKCIIGKQQLHTHAHTDTNRKYHPCPLVLKLLSLKYMALWYGKLQHAHVASPHWLSWTFLWQNVVQAGTCWVSSLSIITHLSTLDGPA